MIVMYKINMFQFCQLIFQSANETYPLVIQMTDNTTVHNEQ